MNITPSLSLAAAAALLLATDASAQQPTPAPAPVNTNPAQAGDGVQIGVARQDGVTLSVDGAVVTRNGATEKLTKDLTLPSGVTVRPDGTVIMADKSEVPLRTTQILTFEGKIVPLPIDPRVNPGDPRGNGTGSIPAGGATQGATAAGGNAAMPPGTSRSLPRGPSAATGSVFLGSDGVPFMGTLNPDGTLLRSDGTVMRADGSFRAVTFAPDGTPTLGTVNSNGTITRADGATVAPDGSVVGANGRMLSPAAHQTNAAGGQSANNPAVNPQAGPGNRPGTGGRNQPGARSGTGSGTNNAGGGTNTGGSGGTGGNSGAAGGASGGSGAGGTGGGSGGSPR